MAVGTRLRTHALVLGFVAAIAGLVSSATVWTVPAQAATDCVDLRFVALRGSGEAGGVAGSTATSLYDAVAPTLPSGTTSALTGIEYPAIGLDPTQGLAGLLSFSAGYDQSRAAGVGALRSYLSGHTSCPNERLVLVGYSQGAHVVGDTLAAKRATVARLHPQDIAAVVLIGDPRFNPRERFDHGSFAHARVGLLGGRALGSFGALAARLGSWCDAGDPICQGLDRGMEPAAHDGIRYVSAHSTEIAFFIQKRVAPQIRLATVRPRPAPILG